jgi:hypothetical protein
MMAFAARALFGIAGTVDAWIRCLKKAGKIARYERRAG